MIASSVCDFCNAPSTVIYRARQHSAPQAVTTIAGEQEVTWQVQFVDPDWFACDECRALIASGQRDALAERSVRASQASGVRDELADLPRSAQRRFEREALVAMRALHDVFWAARLGGPEDLP